jgi:hypothetical protein
MSTAAEEETAVLALLTAGGCTPLTAAEREAHAKAGTLPSRYTEVFISERAVPATRVGGIESRSWRVQTRAVAQIKANAETERAKARDALEEQFFTVGTVESSAITRGATDDPIAPDDGWFSGLSEWVYTR